jgi:glycosyltransferase involved in cell wall biosynthesis
MRVTPTPWYVHDDRGTQSHQRLLLISYHFPPDPSVGARRWEKLAHYAAERGWGLDVITRELSGAGEDGLTTDELARLRALPSGVRIYSIPVEPLAIQVAEKGVHEFVQQLKQRMRVEAPSQLASQQNKEQGQPVQVSPSLPSSFNREDVRWHWNPRRWPREGMRGYWAWVEYAQYLPWVEQAAQLATRIASSDTHLAIVSSGPPHMMHEAARRASVRTKIPFVMDMRDPWSLNEQIVEHIASPVWYRLANYYERKAVNHASLVVANTELARRALHAQYPGKREDIITIMNGADEDPLPPSRKGGRFVIAHAGTIYLDRDPRALFEAAARVICQLQLTPEQFGLEFIGATNGVYPIHDVVRQIGIDRYVYIGPSLPHAKAMEFMANATMLVTMSGSNVTAIPAKTFECVRFEAWLLALSAPGSATELLLQNTEADVVAPNDVDAIAAVIQKRYQQHLAGVTPPRLGDDPRFSRRGQATLLFDAIQERKNH